MTLLDKDAIKKDVVRCLAGAEEIYQKVSSLSMQQQLEYWRDGSDSLRQQIKPAKEADRKLGEVGPRPCMNVN